MNCKQGDLAVIVHARLDPRKIGHIVRCLRLLAFDGIDQCWVVEPRIDGFKGVYDHALRPIRPQRNDAVDEMVQLLGKPEGVTA